MSEQLLEEIMNLVRPEVARMHGYSSARVEGEQEMRIFLDANENPYPPYPGGENEVRLNRYPEVQPYELRTVFGERNGVTAGNVFLSRGADEALDLLVRIFCSEGKDGVILCSPTFPMYEHSVNVQGARLLDVPMTSDFQLDVDRILETQKNDPNIKMMMVASPNNPTANLLRRDDLLRIAQAFRGQTIVVVDQLYIDYSDEPSMVPDIAELPNLVVVRSLSKEHSMAGERIGITISHPTIVSLLRRVAAPYLLSQSSIRAAENVASPAGAAYSAEKIQLILAERTRLQKELPSLDVVAHVYPTDANFFLVKFFDAGQVVKACEAEGIKVRSRSMVPGLENCVRIAVGTPEENDELLRVLRSVAV
jgi:histidinol-phosphate aminotransferase